MYPINTILSLIRSQPNYCDLLLMSLFWNWMIISLVLIDNSFRWKWRCRPRSQRSPRVQIFFLNFRSSMIITLVMLCTWVFGTLQSVLMWGEFEEEDTCSDVVVMVPRNTKSFSKVKQKWQWNISLRNYIAELYFCFDWLCIVGLERIAQICPSHDILSTDYVLEYFFK